MINAEDLFLTGAPGQFLIQLAGRGEVVAKGFFHHDALPAGTLLVQQPGAVNISSTSWSNWLGSVAGEASGVFPKWRFAEGNQ